MFSVKVEQLELMDALKKVKTTIGKGKDPNNIYDKYLYMEIFLNEKCKPELKLLTTNFNEVGEASCELISCSKEGDVCALVDFNIFYSLIETISSSTEIEIKTQLNKNNSEEVIVTYPGRKKAITVTALKSELFQLNNPNDKYTASIKMECGILKEAIDKAANVIVENETYPLFNCVHISIQNGQIVAKGMDSSAAKRMFLFAKRVTNSGNGEFFVECHKAKRLISTMDISKDIEININDNIVVFKQDEIKYVIRLSNGTFPTIERYMPNQYKIEAEFNKEELLGALKRIKIMSDNSKSIKSCIFSIDNMFTSIDLNTTIGSISETVTTILNGNSISMAFSIDSMINSLISIQDTDLKLCFYSNSCVVIMPKNHNGAIHRIMVTAMNMKK